jgi:hypothetical protein
MPLNNSVTINLALNYLYKVFIRSFQHIKLTPVTTKEISEIIKSLTWKNSHGYDEIPVRILKISLPFIISPLTYTCNESLSTGIFPTQLKFIHLFSSLSYDMSKASSKASSPHSAIKSFLFQMRVSSPFLKVIQ